MKSSQIDQQSIAQSRRLRSLLRSKGVLLGPLHRKPRSRWQRLSWTDPIMHRVRNRWTHKKCEWKHGEELLPLGTKNYHLTERKREPIKSGYESRAGPPRRPLTNWPSHGRSELIAHSQFPLPSSLFASWARFYVNACAPNPPSQPNYPSI